jgi:hypothetical protein
MKDTTHIIITCSTKPVVRKVRGVYSETWIKHDGLHRRWIECTVQITGCKHKSKYTELSLFLVPSVFVAVVTDAISIMGYGLQQQVSTSVDYSVLYVSIIMSSNFITLENGVARKLLSPIFVFNNKQILALLKHFKRNFNTLFLHMTLYTAYSLCKICGSHGGGYEECRLLGYKNPSSYFTGDTLRLRYRAQPVNEM